MNVIYLHQYFNTLTMSGSSRSYEFARRLVQAGHTVHMVTSCREPPAGVPVGDWYSTVEAGIQVHWLINPYSNDMSLAERMRAFKRYAVQSARKAAEIPGDVIFATSTPLTVALPALFAKWRKKIPMVFEVRDLWPDVPIALGALRNPLARWAARRLEHMAYHNASHLIALSPGMAKGIARRGIPQSRISVIPNSCDRELFATAPDAGQTIRARLGLTPSQPLVVYTGTFGRVNGVGYLIAVAEHLTRRAPAVRFLLVGSGQERDQIVQHARNAHLLDQQVFVWPPVEKCKIPEILAAATLSVSTVIPVPALWENSANKFFDALAAGRPIAINHEGWQADLIRAHQCGLVLAPNHPEKAAEQLAQFLQSPATVRQAGLAAQKLAATFDRDVLYVQFERILRHAFHAGGGAPFPGKSAP